MCGIVGFLGVSPVDTGYFTELCHLAERRGPHAFGLAWRAEDVIRRHTVSQPLTGNEAMIDSVKGAIAVIGQARLATFGSWENADNNQPLLTGSGAISHNGNIYNAQDLAAKYELKPKTDVDSEVLGLLIDKLGPYAAMDLIESNVPQALIYLSPTKLFVIRRGHHPLYVISRPEGKYLCSLDPGGGEVVPQGLFKFA